MCPVCWVFVVDGGLLFLVCYCGMLLLGCFFLASGVWFVFVGCRGDRVHCIDCSDCIMLLLLAGASAIGEMSRGMNCVPVVYVVVVVVGV